MQRLNVVHMHFGLVLLLSCHSWLSLAFFRHLVSVSFFSSSFTLETHVATTHLHIRWQNLTEQIISSRRTLFSIWMWIPNTNVRSMSHVISAQFFFLFISFRLFHNKCVAHAFHSLYILLIFGKQANIHRVDCRCLCSFIFFLLSFQFCSCIFCFIVVVVVDDVSPGTHSVHSFRFAYAWTSKWWHN